MAQVVQGHHVIPQAIYRDFRSLFDQGLPGWNIDGDYNLDARPTSMIGSAQLDAPRHSGNHKALNDALEDLLTDLQKNYPPSDWSNRLGQLVNFLEDGNNLQNLAANSPTGGFVAFTNLKDPHLIQELGYVPNTESLKADYFSKHLDWDNIASTPSGQAVANLNVRLVDGQLTYDSPNGTGIKGFFSIESEQLAASVGCAFMRTFPIRPSLSTLRTHAHVALYGLSR